MWRRILLNRSLLSIAGFSYSVDRRLRHRLPGNSSFRTGQEVSHRGSEPQSTVGSDDSGHTTVVALRADHWFAGLVLFESGTNSGPPVWSQNSQVAGPLHQDRDRQTRFCNNAKRAASVLYCSVSERCKMLKRRGHMTGPVVGLLFDILPALS
jgi:hypothetical protein